MSVKVWNQAAWRNLDERRRRDSLPHAIVMCGPSGLGKRPFADALAAALLCPAVDAQGHACGTCRACLLLAAGTHPDMLRISFELRDDGKPRTEITVDQMRGLSERLTLTSQFGGRQVVIVDPADAMNISASNALLKTLEEPTAGTVIILVADHPARLSATIRSRCQRIDFRVPSSDTARQWLQEQGIDDALAHEALLAGDGNPGLALAWVRSGAMKMRSEVAKDLRELQAGVASAFDTAQRWSRDEVELRLRFAAALAQQQGRAQVQGGSAMIAGGPLALTAAVDLPKLTAWFDQANRTREWLRGPLRADLALLELLTAWVAAGTRGGTADSVRRSTRT